MAASVPKQPNDKNSSSHKPRLEQLDGFRFLVAFWLVLAHNFDPNNESPVLYERFCVRRYVAVSFFIILSGFVSQYAYGHRDLSSSRQVVRKFYISRIGSILACYYATMILAIILRMAAGHYTVEYCVKGSILSLFLLQTWFPRYAYFGNTPAWTLSTLVAHWAAYPLMQPRLQRLDSSMLWCMAILAPFVALIPSVSLLIANSGALHNSRQWYMLYTHPVFRLIDFAFGAILSELFVRSDGTWARALWLAKLSDVAMTIIFLLILAVPYSARNSVYDTVMIEAPMHLFGLLVYGSSCNPRGSIGGYVMSLQPCRKLGDFAFQVYLWRWPLFAAIHWLETGELRRGWMALSLPYFVPSIILLYVWSYVWFLKVDTPLRHYLYELAKPSDLSQDLLPAQASVRQEEEQQQQDGSTQNLPEVA